MQAIIRQFEQAQRKTALPPVRSGDTVRVHQRIREGSKQRVQVFEGVVIRTHRPNELSANLTVRRLSGGIGVEKSFLLHSPNVVKLQILRRAKVRRNFLSYLRDRRGKAARLQELGFDRSAANSAAETTAPQVEASTTEPDSETVMDASNEPTMEADVPLEKVVRAEDQAAAAADAVADSVAAEDETASPAQEAQQGLDRAEKQDS